MNNPARPGYVYVVSNPSLMGWVKVGHTTRPPHIRARELSRTSWPTPFEISGARFSWDAPATERWVHGRLSKVSQKIKELFHTDLSTALSVLDMAPRPLLPSMKASEIDFDAPGAWRQVDDWGVSLEGLLEQWEWGEEEKQSKDPAERRRGWARHYALSAQGWAQGTQWLGDALAAPGTADAAMRAAWLYQAAEDQGQPGGMLRAAWIRSLHQKEALAEFQRHVARWVAHQDSGKPLPAWVEETLLEEQALWRERPERMFDPRAVQAHVILPPSPGRRP